MVNRPSQRASVRLGSLRAHAHSFKKVWKRVVSSSSLLVEQIAFSFTTCCVVTGSQGRAKLPNVMAFRRTKQCDAALAYLRLDPADENADTVFNDFEGSSSTENSYETEYREPSCNAEDCSVESFSPAEARNRTDTCTSGRPSCNTIVLKISILGDSETGKTSFVAKYAYGPEQLCTSTCSAEFVPDKNCMGVATVLQKVLHVRRNTNIAFRIWDKNSAASINVASTLSIMCRDAAAIVIMFDLTRLCTLHSVKEWITRARECNKAAMMVMVGTKYDKFVELPRDAQRTVMQQARTYGRCLGASALFFSSVTHNINVHKVFKVIVAKLFDVPCPTIPTNLTLGEPLVDY